MQVADFGLARDGFDMRSKVGQPTSLPESRPEGDMCRPLPVPCLHALATLPCPTQGCQLLGPTAQA